jgi:hypothetical protein
VNVQAEGMSDPQEAFGILSPGGEFELPELCAMMLDQVLVPVFGQAFRSVAEPETPALRAAAMASLVPDNLAGRAALGRMSAAWVYGCAPRPATVCLLISSGHRSSALPARSGCSLHEVRLDPFDVERLGGAQVTCALRTAVDVAISEPADSATAALWALASSASLNCPLGRIRAAVAAASHIPGKRRALELIDDMLAGRPAWGQAAAGGGAWA